MKLFKPAKNEIVIYIDFKCNDNGRLFYRSTESIKCKGDALDLQDIFRTIQQQLKFLKFNRPDLISDKLVAKDMLPVVKIENCVVKFEGRINDSSVSLEFLDAEQFLIYLADKELIADYAATNLFAVYYPDHPFNFIRCDIFLMSSQNDDSYSNCKKSNRNQLYLYKDSDGIFYYVEGNRQKQHLKDDENHQPFQFPLDAQFNSSKYDNKKTIEAVIDITSKRGHTIFINFDPRRCVIL